MKNTPSISVVSPVYRAAESLPRLVAELNAVAERMGTTFEIVLIDDRSPDESWTVIQQLCEKNANVRGARLSRNFGQHYAITAGIAHATGDCIVVMDCDLQDNPAYIPQLYAKIGEGYDVVVTRKRARNESWLRRTTARIFFAVYNRISDRKVERNTGGYSIISRRVAQAFLSVTDQHRHYSLILAWLGFRRAVIEVEHAEREQGESSYTLAKLIEHAVAGLVSQSTSLLRWSLYLGFLFVAASLTSVIYIVAMYRFHHYQAGWPSIAVLVLFCSGVILGMIGILGMYIGKIFEQVKGRPLYILSEEASQVHVAQQPRRINQTL